MQFTNPPERAIAKDALSLVTTLLVIGLFFGLCTVAFLALLYVGTRDSEGIGEGPPQWGEQRANSPTVGEQRGYSSPITKRSV
ncbi:hypothetical protein GCM10011515_21550 [Tsuneonella deserti]|uniref:Uncharacterized protein n=1 Tax=Tsuneonella deserti TaxID=2035528 RepID=A0ABQ1SC26_9SPHN|nr:hypothetical protein GCM10011515_21550 [Tsuneonella deserti]